MNQDKTPPRALWICLVTFIVVFLGYTWFSWHFANDPGIRVGQFGDAFGALNALISGFAFFGVAYAIVQQHQSLRLQGEQTRMQSEELRLQREELKATREEMERSTSAQQKTSSALAAEMALIRIRTELDILLIFLRQEYAHVDNSHADLIGNKDCESLNPNWIQQHIKSYESQLAGASDGNIQCLVNNLKQIAKKRHRLEALYDELTQLKAS